MIVHTHCSKERYVWNVEFVSLVGRGLSLIHCSCADISYLLLWPQL
jgi:hypothetical protein